MPNKPSVRVLRSVGDLESIRQLWESWPGNRDSEMNSYLKFIESNRATVRPHIVVVEREGRPDVILVGRIDRGQINGRIGYVDLKLPARVLYFVYGALRGNPSSENCDILLSSVIQSLSAKEADVAYMNFINEDSALFRLSIEKPGLLCKDYVRIRQPHFAARLPNSAEEFYRGLSSNSRWQAKTKQKKLIKDFAGNIKVRCFREVTELDALVGDVEQVAKTSYQRGLGVGFIDSPEMRERLRLKAERGWLRGYVLYVAGRPRAFWIGDMNAGSFGSDYLAYDAELGKYSPGMCLILKVIEGFYEDEQEKVTGVDFATGHAQYKEVLSNQNWMETSVHIFAPSMRGLCLNAFRSMVEGADKAIKKILFRMHLLQRIKKLWRERAKPKDASQARA
jgi:Acetyltransferase (GNAT) domain